METRNTVREAITQAVLAGGLRAAARTYPEARAALQAEADRHSARAATLARRICVAAAERLLDLAATPAPPHER